MRGERAVLPEADRALPALVAVGTNHRTAPVALREQLAVPAGGAGGALAAVTGALRAAGAGGLEAAVLSTCNRTELYVCATGLPPADLARRALAALAEHRDAALYRQGGLEALEAHTYRLAGPDAVAGHLFRVAAGLDSLVLGETQILGQVKAAYAAARRAGTSGKHLSRLFQGALRAGKRVHAETEFGQCAVSIGYAAVELGKKIFGRLDGRRVAVLGAGKMGRLAATNLRGAGAGEVLVLNRTPARAARLADAIGGRAAGLDALFGWLEAGDVLITCTDAPEVLIRAEAVRDVILARRGRPLLVIDLAVPRDVDPAVGRLPGVFHYTVDDLEAVVRANREERARLAAEAEAVVAAERDAFVAWWHELDAVPLITSLRHRADELRRRELERLFARLPDVDGDTRAALEAFSIAYMNKLLNDPTQAIKAWATDAEGRHRLDALWTLFGLGRE